MGINSYNNETKHSELIKDIKTLPKINAPENFELNLMTKIQNQNFGGVKEERIHFNFVKFLAPSAVVVTAFIILFLFLSPGQQDINNPLITNPPAIVNDTQGDISSAGKDLALNKLNNAKEKTSDNSKPLLLKKSETIIKSAKLKNDAAVGTPSKYPINRNRSVALDDFISGDTQQGANIQRGNVVNSGEEAQDLEGFFVRQEPDKDALSRYRAQMDSVKKAQLKADSIKKAAK